MNTLLKKDLYRLEGKKVGILKGITLFLKKYYIRYIYFYRKNGVINRIILKRYEHKYQLNIFSKNIGGGLYLPHPYNITINYNVIIGDNCNINNGVTIGCEPRGKRKGTPIIGNKVWIGANAVIVGNIKIGNNVLIAPNTFVNCDIPSNSIVFGNPAIIKEKLNATTDYINNEYNTGVINED